MIEYTGNIQVHHPDPRDEDMAAIWSTHRAAINRLLIDQNNPDGDL